MTDESPRELDWPTRRWLLWGLVAIAVLAAVVAFFIWFANAASDSDDTGNEDSIVGQVEWSITLSSQGGQSVTLKADEPDAAMSETWVDGAMLERGASDRWAWDMEIGLPEPVVEIDEAEDCAALNARLDEWVSSIGAALGEVFDWQSRAFAQHAFNTMTDQGCEIDESLLEGL